MNMMWWDKAKHDFVQLADTPLSTDPKVQVVLDNIGLIFPGDPPEPIQPKPRVSVADRVDLYMKDKLENPDIPLTTMDIIHFKHNLEDGHYLDIDAMLKCCPAQQGSLAFGPADVLPPGHVWLPRSTTSNMSERLKIQLEHVKQYLVRPKPFERFDRTYPAPKWYKAQYASTLEKALVKVHMFEHALRHPGIRNCEKYKGVLSIRGGIGVEYFAGKHFIVAYHECVSNCPGTFKGESRSKGLVAGHMYVAMMIQEYLRYMLEGMISQNHPLNKDGSLNLLLIRLDDTYRYTKRLAGGAKSEYIARWKGDQTNIDIAISALPPSLKEKAKRHEMDEFVGMHVHYEIWHGFCIICSVVMILLMLPGLRPADPCSKQGLMLALAVELALWKAMWLCLHLVPTRGTVLLTTRIAYLLQSKGAWKTLVKDPSLHQQLHASLDKFQKLVPGLQHRCNVPGCTCNMIHIPWCFSDEAQGGELLPPVLTPEMVNMLPDTLLPGELDQEALPRLLEPLHLSGLDDPVLKDIFAPVFDMQHHKTELKRSIAKHFFHRMMNPLLVLLLIAAISWGLPALNYMQPNLASVPDDVKPLHVFNSRANKHGQTVPCWHAAASTFYRGFTKVPEPQCPHKNRHIMITLLKNLTPDDPEFLQIVELLDTSHDSIIEAASGGVANIAGNSLRVWERFYDRWDDERNAKVAPLVVELVQAKVLREAVIGQDHYKVVKNGRGVHILKWCQDPDVKEAVKASLATPSASQDGVHSHVDGGAKKWQVHQFIAAAAAVAIKRLEQKAYEQGGGAEVDETQHAAKATDDMAQGGTASQGGKGGQGVRMGAKAVSGGELERGSRGRRGSRGGRGYRGGINARGGKGGKGGERGGGGGVMPKLQRTE